MQREEEIRRAARDAGFDLCGIARAAPPPHADFFRSWLDHGCAAEMDYLAAGADKRCDPSLVLPSVRSIISLGIRYAPAPPPPVRWREELRGRIAAYARGRDYHDVLRKRLKRFTAALRERFPMIEHRSYVDSGPILERDWAAQAGIGWFGKNTNLLHRQHGSWFFLAEVLTSIDLEPSPPGPEHCGTCVTCLDRCPTGALLPGYRLDARRCISYWTIEHRGMLPVDIRSELDCWIFGCDVCQEVCPWNEKMRPPEVDAFLTPFLPDLLALDEAGFRDRFRGSAVRRTKREGLLRNVAVVLGNSGNPAAVAPLAMSLRSDESPVVRAHAAWALGALGIPAAKRALDATRRDPDPRVRTEVEAALERSP